MKFAKIVGILLVVYIVIVTAFESLLGYFQPAGGNTIVISTADEDGSHDRVVSLLESNDNKYVAVNHWPRAWYYRALENPDIHATIDGVKNPYRAVAVDDDDEHDRVQSDNPTGVVFRILTGFPPRYFVRLDAR